MVQRLVEQGKSQTPNEGFDQPISLQELEFPMSVGPSQAFSLIKKRWREEEKGLGP